MQHTRCGGKEWLACSGRGDYEVPRLILFFVAAKENSTRSIVAARVGETFLLCMLRRFESDAERCCGRDRCHSSGFLLRIMPPSWYPVPACVRHGHSACGPFFCAAAMVLHRLASLALKSRITARWRAFPVETLQ